MRTLRYHFREAQRLRGRYDRLSASYTLYVMHFNGRTAPASAVLRVPGAGGADEGRVAADRLVGSPGAL